MLGSPGGMLGSPGAAADQPGVQDWYIPCKSTACSRLQHRHSRTLVPRYGTYWNTVTTVHVQFGR
jgi:hypothetical protein